MDVIEDPDEAENLIDSDDLAVQTARARLEARIPLFPELDNDPIYIPQPPQLWDVPVTVQSMVWKK